MAKTKFKTGDVVYAEGASALLGDVQEVWVENDISFEHVTVKWRSTVTTEDADDLEFAKEKTPWP